MSAPDESAVIDLALLGHPESYEHFGDLVLHERPDYGRDRLERYRATLERFFEWTPSYASGTAFGVRSPRGPCVTGSLVVCPFLPDTAQSVAGLARAAAKTRQGCEVARRRGARIVALGGLTSV
ncbi:MAG: hypothetical protein ACRD26_01325, partial [Vicinamibacterales bacterium]